jgi:serine/threonine protein kinase
MLCDLAQCGLVHRDIKAANVLLSQPWGSSTSQSPPVLKLADWGGAAHAGVVDGRKQTTGTRGERGLGGRLYTQAHHPKDSIPTLDMHGWCLVELGKGQTLRGGAK